MRSRREQSFPLVAVTLAVFVVLQQQQVLGDIVCRDELNQPVDWFTIYKLPKLSHSSNEFIRQGLGHAYLTSSANQSSWVLSQKAINDSNSMPGLTLNPVYEASKKKADDLWWLMYNDQSPDQPVSYLHGHTKGVLLSDGSSGLWLVHSVPHFPPPANRSYGYPATGEHYGQTMLCISLVASDMEVIGGQLMYNFPKIFSSLMPSSMLQNFPQIASVIQGSHVRTAPFYRRAVIRSRTGTEFVSFAKTAQFNKDLYADWVSQSLQTNLLVESWPNGPGRLPSSCQRNFSVENIQLVQITTTKQQVSFRDQQDHSKWAVQSADTETEHWLCIGDINRMMSQEERAGGTVCFNNRTPWRAFRNAVAQQESCGNGTLKFNVF